MNKRLIYLLIIAAYIFLLPLKSKSADLYEVQWSSQNESGVIYYQVLQSSDSLKWNPIATIAPSGTIYTYTLPATAYYRILTATSYGNFFTPVKYIDESISNAVATDSVKISPISVTYCNSRRCSYTDVIKWTSSFESNLSYYAIFRGGISLGIVSAKGIGTYTYQYYRKGKSTASYWIQPFYKDAKAGVIIKK